jgi:hypothetical protein
LHTDRNDTLYPSPAILKVQTEIQSLNISSIDSELATTAVVGSEDAFSEGLVRYEGRVFFMRMVMENTLTEYPSAGLPLFSMRDLWSEEWWRGKGESGIGEETRTEAE